MLADELDYVVGVDPHRDTHALAIVHAGTGAAVFGGQVVASERGYAQALRRAERDAPGRRAWAIEGTGSYGAGLTRFLSARGERVLEVGRTRRERRSRAKTDAIDALRAARSVLGTVQLASPRAAGEREALRALMVARAGALAAKKAGLCQLRALLVTCPEPLRSELRSLTRARLLRRLAAVRPNRHQDAELRGTLIALRALARRVQALTAEERELKREIQALVARLARTLLDEPGVGPVAAAQVLISWSHRGRFRSDAAFARLAGAAPLAASSGLVLRHRLDPGGDRQLNRALHTIIVSRRKNHAPTITYIERKTREGKSVREAIRCLKRHLARHVFRLLEAGPIAA
jgi:transposase